MISVATFIQVLVSIFCTVVAGVILFMFQAGKKKQEKDRDDRVTADVCQQELIMSMADAIEVIMRKQNNEEMNGEVNKAMADLEEKKIALRHLTRRIYFEKMDS